MTEDQLLLQRTSAGITARVAKKTAVLCAAGAAGALIIQAASAPAHPWWFLPASLLFGGLLGILNFRWLALAVERVYLRKGATPAGSNIAGIFISMLKLTVIFIVLFIVIKWRLLHLFSLLAGLSLCFLSILWEGVTIMGRLQQEK